MSYRKSIALGTALFTSVCILSNLFAEGLGAGTDLEPEFAADYSFDDLGSITDLPTPYGGLTFKHDDPGVLLIGGAANTASGAIYEVQVDRGCAGQVTGFTSGATLLATAPNIDGGLTYGPDGVLFYTGYPTNILGQIKPGSTEPDKIIALPSDSSVGTIQFVPDGFGGAGRLKILSYNASSWFDCTLVPDGSGTFDLVDVTFHSVIGGGPEGLVFVRAGSPQFDNDSAVISEYGTGQIVTYEVDSNADPIVKTKRVMLTGLGGAEGATIDQGTGDFFFSTFGGSNRVVIIRGFSVPCAADLVDNDVVDVNDLLVLLLAWGNTCTQEDINGDGIVDVGDLLPLLSQWGPCP